MAVGVLFFSEMRRRRNTGSFGWWVFSQFLSVDTDRKELKKYSRRDNKCPCGDTIDFYFTNSL